MARIGAVLLGLLALQLIGPGRAGAAEQWTEFRPPGQNYQVYYPEQAPTYVMLQSTLDPGNGTHTRVTGSPEAGLTNLQTWAKYGIAIAGAVSPTTQVLDGITGFVQPI